MRTRWPWFTCLFLLTLVACDGGGESDAGVDAALPETDSGTNPVDAGVMEVADAGSDAGPELDASVALDAGPGDAGPGDAGPSDAGFDGGYDPDDPDGDGVLTTLELACGTDPEDSGDVPDAAALRGAGTEGDPYRICFPQHLVLLAAAADVLTASVRVGDDLDLTGLTLADPIGTMGAPFLGVFDGDGHTLDNLTVGSSDDRRAGIFGAVGRGGALRDLRVTGASSAFGSVLVNLNAGDLSDVHVEGSAIAADHIGLVVNRNLAGGVISDCSAAGTVTASSSHAGGLAGSSEGRIVRSWSTAQVSGRNRTGGLVGSGEGAIIESYATGNVSGSGFWIGGVTGTIRGAGLIEDVFALGDVSAAAGEAGGVVGNIEATATVRRVYARNTVTGATVSGGVLGVDSASGTTTVEDCYFDSSLTAADPAGCTGLTASEMEMQASYTSFDFVTVPVWRVDAGIRATPSLAWE